MPESEVLTTQQEVWMIDTGADPTIHLTEVDERCLRTLERHLDRVHQVITTGTEQNSTQRNK